MRMISYGVIWFVASVALVTLLNQNRKPRP